MERFRHPLETLQIFREPFTKHQGNNPRSIVIWETAMQRNPAKCVCSLPIAIPRPSKMFLHNYKSKSEHSLESIRRTIPGVLKKPQRAPNPTGPDPAGRKLRRSVFPNGPRGWRVGPDPPPTCSYFLTACLSPPLSPSPVRPLSLEAINQREQETERDSGLRSEDMNV